MILQPASFIWRKNRASSPPERASVGSKRRSSARTAAARTRALLDEAVASSAPSRALCRARAAASASRRSRRRGSRQARLRGRPALRRRAPRRRRRAWARNSCRASPARGPRRRRSWRRIRHPAPRDPGRHCARMECRGGALDVTHGEPGRRAGLRADRRGFVLPSLSTITTSKRGRGTCAKRCAPSRRAARGALRAGDRCRRRR